MIPGKDFVGVGCGAVILNDKNQILLMKRGKECRNKAGFWTIPGGRVELFETFQDAIKREVLEEIGVEVQVIKLISLTDDIIKEEDQHWVSPQYLCKITNGEIKNMEPHKCDELKWFDLNDLPDKLTNTTMNVVINFKNF